MHVVKRKRPAARDQARAFLLRPACPCKRSSWTAKQAHRSRPNGRLLAESQVIAKDATSFILVAAFWCGQHVARGSFPAPPPLGQPLKADAMAQHRKRLISAEGRARQSNCHCCAFVDVVDSADASWQSRDDLSSTLVLEVVRRNIDAKRYGAAFRICRTHRMDVNILYDHDPDSFMANTALFRSASG